MKKLAILCSFILLLISASAQVEKGKILIAGTTSFSFTSSDIKFEYDGQELGEYEDKQSSLTFSPLLGYFVIDNLAVGLDLGFTSSKRKIGDGDWSDTKTSFATALFGRYYLSLEKFKPFAQAKFGYMVMNDGSGEDIGKDAGLIYGFGVGADYFINNSVALELGVSYEMGKLKNKDDAEFITKPGILTVGIGIAVTIGGE